MRSFQTELFADVFDVGGLEQLDSFLATITLDITTEKRLGFSVVTDFPSILEFFAPRLQRVFVAYLYGVIHENQQDYALFAFTTDVHPVVLRRSSESALSDPFVKMVIPRSC